MTSSRTVTRLARILALIPYVLDRDSVDIEEIKSRFNYTEAQLSKDLNTIFVCGLPGYGPGDLMEAYVDEDEVVIDAADYFSKAPRLTPPEALGLLASGLTVLGTGEGSPALESAVRKLTKVTMPEADTSLVVDVMDRSEYVGILREAASASRQVKIVYRSVGKEEETTRIIEPWSVFTTLGRWYVHARCQLVDDARTFRVDRIRELEVLDETYEPPAKLPEPGVGYSPAEGDISCVIDLTPRARWVLEYYPVDVIAETKNKTRIEFHAPDAEVPARLLFRLGGDAKLVQGEEVLSRTKELGATLLKRYS